MDGGSRKASSTDRGFSDVCIIGKDPDGHLALSACFVLYFDARCYVGTPVKNPARNGRLTTHR